MMTRMEKYKDLRESIKKEVEELNNITPEPSQKLELDSESVINNIDAMTFEDLVKAIADVCGDIE